MNVRTRSLFSPAGNLLDLCDNRVGLHRGAVGAAGPGPGHGQVEALVVGVWGGEDRVGGDAGPHQAGVVQAQHVSQAAGYA